MGSPDPERHARRQRTAFLLRAVALVLLIPALLVIALAAFNLQGYQNDPQSAVFQTWPIGATSLALAAALTWMVIRPSEDLPQKIVAAGTFVAFMFSWILVLS
jgi:hypothetical protein